MEAGGLPPVDMAGDDRQQSGEEGQRGRHRGDRHRDLRHDGNAHQVDDGESDDDGRGQRLDRKVREIPLLDGGGREQGGQAAGRHPPPPVADPCQVGEHRAVGPEGLGAGRGDAADPVGVHQDQLGPAGRCRPAEQQPEGEQRHGGAALAEDIALADEQRADQEQALVAAAHRHGGGADPADRPRMRRRALDLQVPRSGRDRGVHRIPVLRRRQRGRCAPLAVGSGTAPLYHGKSRRSPRVRTGSEVGLFPIQYNRALVFVFHEAVAGADRRTGGSWHEQVNAPKCNGYRCILPRIDQFAIIQSLNRANYSADSGHSAAGGWPHSCVVGSMSPGRLQ